MDTFHTHQRFGVVYVCINSDQLKSCLELEKISQGITKPTTYFLILKFIGCIKKINEWKILVPTKAWSAPFESVLM